MNSEHYSHKEQKRIAEGKLSQSPALVDFVNHFAQVRFDTEGLIAEHKKSGLQIGKNNIVGSIGERYLHNTIAQLAENSRSVNTNPLEEVCETDSFYIERSCNQLSVAGIRFKRKSDNNAILEIDDLIGIDNMLVAFDIKMTTHQAENGVFKLFEANRRKKLNDVFYEIKGQSHNSYTKLAYVVIIPSEVYKPYACRPQREFEAAKGILVPLPNPLREVTSRISKGYTSKENSDLNYPSFS